MYKTIEIKDIIGLICIKFPHKREFKMQDIRRLMNEVREADDFITTRYSRDAILHVEEILNQEIDEASNLIPQDETIRRNFSREYYRVDSVTRSVVVNVINKSFER